MKFYCRFLLALFFIGIFTNQADAQKQFITGKVLDEAGKPVAYATLAIRAADGAMRGGTIALEDGSYRVELPGVYFSIECSHVNYRAKSEKIEGNTVINFVLARASPGQLAIAVAGTHKYSPDERKIMKNKKADAIEDENRIFTRVEVDASFIGGGDALKQYLAKAVIYPDSASISDVKGTVKVGFVIGTNGMVNNVTLLKGINKFTDELVMRAVTKMPAWLPAMQNGRNVEQYKEVSVSFDIKGVE